MGPVILILVQAVHQRDNYQWGIGLTENLVEKPYLHDIFDRADSK